MKTTNEWCFGQSLTSCATALSRWEYVNCMNCAKARFVNIKTGRMPKYHCAIQAQIEQQAADGTPVNVRTFDAVHGRTECAMFRGCDNNEPETPVIDAHEFAQGVCMNHPDANGVQTELQTKPQTAERPATPRPEMSQAEAREQAEQIQKRRMDEIATRIANDGLPDEWTFRKQIKDDVNEIMESFTFEEHKRIAHIPLVIQFVAWHYAIRARRYAADQRIAIVKPLARAVDKMHTQWMDTLRLDLDYIHIRRLEQAAEQFMADTGNDQTILWLQVKQAYMTQHPDDIYMDLRALAMCAILLAQFVLDYQSRIDRMVSERLHAALRPIPWPHMNGLIELMKGYVDDWKIETTPNIEMCMKIMNNRIGCIRWIENV